MSWHWPHRIVRILRLFSKGNQTTNVSNILFTHLVITCVYNDGVWCHFFFWGSHRVYIIFTNMNIRIRHGIHTFVLINISGAVDQVCEPSQSLISIFCCRWMFNRQMLPLIQFFFFDLINYLFVLKRLRTWSHFRLGSAHLLTTEVHSEHFIVNISWIFLTLLTSSPITFFDCFVNITYGQARYFRGSFAILEVLSKVGL